MRRALRWFLYTFGVLLLVVIGAATLLQTGPGKRLLASQLSSFLSTPDAGVDIADIEGWLPIDMRIGSLRLSDQSGVWLSADGVTLDWSPSALIGRRIQIDAIAAERIELARLPPSDDTEEPASDEPFRLPELPGSLPPVTVERLALPEIVLGAPVLGEAAGFALEGSIRASDSGDTVTADLALERTDRPTASASLDATAGLDPPTLDLALKAAESGGMIAALAGRPDMGDVDLSLDGSGALDDWSGRLRAEAGGLALVEADLGLMLVDQPRLTLSGALQPEATLFPEDFTDLIGERLSIDLDLVQTKAQALDLRKAAVAIDLATLDAEGTVDFDAGDLALRSQLRAPDLAPLSTLAGAQLSGAAVADLDLAGTLDAPSGKLDLQVDDPAFDGNSAEAIRAALAWTATAPLSSDRPAFDITTDGRAEGMTIPGAVLPDPDVSWSAGLTAPLEGEIAIERVLIETAGSSLSAHGAIDPQALDGTIDLALDVPSLKRLAEPYGQPLDGKALIEAAIRLADQAKTVAVDLDASLDELAGLPPGAAELIGRKADVRTRAALDPSGMLTLDGLSVDGAAIKVDGQASLQPDRQDINGELAVALPDLGVLDQLIAGGAAGALDLKADLGGSLEAPAADLRITGRDLVLSGEPITALGVTMTGEDLVKAPKGDLQIDLTARDMPTALALDYHLADGVLALDAIDLNAPETELGGDLALALDTTLVEGTLQGRIADLAALAPLTGQQLAGGVDLAATLVPNDDRQHASLLLKGADVAGDFGRLKTIDAEARIADVRTEPQIDAKASLTGFEQGAAAIDALTLKASGDDEGLDVELNLAGQVLQPLELGTAATIAFVDGLALDIARLEGAFAGEPIRLVKPMALRQTENALTVADLDLRLGDAGLAGDVEIGETSVSGTLDLRSLPLRWSEVFGGPSLAGEAQADIDLSGSASSPKVVAALEVDGLLAKDVVADERPLDISLNALLDRGRLAADLEASRLTRKPITATASLPARLQLRPFAFDMPKDGALDGRIEAELLLARLADILALDDQTMKGTLTADIAIGGTLGEPKIEGPVRLEDGGYENGATGTDLRDVSMVATASNERIDITELAGRTGRKRGTIASKGWLQFDADADFPLSVSLEFDEARLVNRDDIDGRISGDIAMTGNLGQAEVKGNLTVDRAEIAIPDNGGPSLPEIEVTEVGGRIVNPPEEKEGESAEKPFDPSLDVRVRLPNKIYVRGRGLESEWEGDLRITGRASDPIIVGDLGIKKGYFDFLDKRFELAQGDITFSGASPPNPIIALEARAEDDDFTAIIKLNGPADDPQLLLSSEPVLPDDEVLARLLFNRQLSEIGPVEAGKLALAVNRLRGGGGGFDAFGEIRGILNIDTLDVVSDEEGETAVKAGKYLDDDVYVEVEKGAAEESGRARVEIELLPNIAVEAETSENADSGVGIKWKLDY